ncbi:MAG: hypothetical protein WCG80_12110 [Spirochaetales bacterium]
MGPWPPVVERQAPQVAGLGHQHLDGIGLVTGAGKPDLVEAHPGRMFVGTQQLTLQTGRIAGLVANGDRPVVLLSWSQARGKPE